MNYVWKFDSIDDYLNIVNMAKKNGKKPGEPMTEELIEYCKQKGIKPIGATELNKEELIREYTSKDNNVLSLDINKEGKQIIKINKKDNK